ncbi:hypothetical protein, partial [Prevotella pallens]|uniref:hypothetical protein n=1 Tax=Prevotella pallens TaxID=60133 RepID=UPI0023F010CD
SQNAEKCISCYCSSVSVRICPFFFHCHYSMNYLIVGRWHICRLASFVSAFSLLSNHDFGMI